MSGKDRAVPIKVERLLGLYNPFRQFFARHPTLESVKRAKRVDGRDAEQPSRWSDRRKRAWDLGRVRYFVELLEQGAELDPIEIDNHCTRGHIYGPILLDGHHRLCAAALLKAPTIRASYGGRVDILKYLVGKTKLPPRDLT